MSKRLTITAALAAAAATAVAIGPGAAASNEGRCKTVNGHLEERQGPGPGFTATGRLTGGIQGTDHFTLLSTSPTDESTPSVINFVGKSVFDTKRGEIELTVSGAFDTETGKFSDLLTITGATGKWQDASGQLHLFGFFDIEAGVGESDYRGEICTA
jgi:hypothetical protein